MKDLIAELKKSDPDDMIMIKSEDGSGFDFVTGVNQFKAVALENGMSEGGRILPESDYSESTHGGIEARLVGLTFTR
ncbi:hypothetical protein [Salinicola lusitanus]|uniref:hypothetical protein n=1 Tax=Salinicola lusitanus TaxID=1949085 RepID=UPI00130042F0|nr:hypothetical protein [Salinicola lusitanus]